MAGKIEAIWIKRSKRGPMDPAQSANLVERAGIEGDANFGRTRRQVTVIEREVFDRIRETLPDAEPRMRRANVMVSGLRLRDTRDQMLRMGDTTLHVRGETRPCERMDEQCPGLTRALDPDWGGGVFGVVLEGGQIRVGDEAELHAQVPGRRGHEEPDSQDPDGRPTPDNEPVHADGHRPAPETSVT